MDPVSQAALGAAWAQPAAGRARLATASLLGCLAGMAPDLDILIRSSSDPLLALEYHRQFTHSLAFIPFGALICALAFYPFCRRRVSAAQCYLFCLLGYASHGVLDACTTYGTQLFWPFSNVRIAWNNVSVVDPLFTLPLIGLVLMGVWRRQAGFAAAGVCWAIFYLGFGVVQHNRATVAAGMLAADRGHVPARLDAMPALGSLLLWRTVYEYDGRYYVDAVRTGVGLRVYPGSSVPKLDVGRDLPWLREGTQQARDLERFRWFTNDYLAPDAARPGVVIDLRYSLVPNSTDGFWGIELDPRAPPGAHAGYVTMRNRSLSEGETLLEMLFPGPNTGSTMNLR